MFRYYFNIHRWKCSQNDWIECLRRVPFEHVEYLRQFHYQRDAKFSLIGQLLIRYLLSRSLEKNSTSFVIKRDRFHRPYVCSHPSFDLNLSHQNALVAIAGTFDGRVGCDTMLIRSSNQKRIHRQNYQLLKEKILNKDEENFLMTNTSTDEERHALFLRFWTLKESYVKWLGQGLRYPMKTIHLHLSSTSDFPSQTTRLFSNEILRFDEQLISFENDQQLIAVCLSSSTKWRSFQELTLDDLLHQCSSFHHSTFEDDLQRSWKEFLQKDSSSF